MKRMKTNLQKSKENTKIKRMKKLENMKREINLNKNQYKEILISTSF